MYTDLSRRPESYWSPSSLLDSLRGTISGTRRREILGSLLEQGETFPVLQQLLNEHLSLNTKQVWASIHPSFLGGEFLPERAPGEVEIARLELASVTADVISVRARPSGNRIYYRVVDEYETRFTVRPAWSIQPLTLWQVISLINTAISDWRETPGLIYPVIDVLAHDGTDIDELQRFVRVSSTHYPELEGCFDAAFSLWAQRKEMEVAA